MASTPKVIFVGNARTNKTNTLRALLLDTRRNKHVPTLGVDVSPYVSTKGTTYNIWDCSGSHGGMRDAYWSQANVCVVFVSKDEDTKYTIYTPEQWVADVKRVSPTCVVHVVHEATPNMIRELLP